MSSLGNTPATGLYIIFHISLELWTRLWPKLGHYRRQEYVDTVADVPYIRPELDFPS